MVGMGTLVSIYAGVVTWDAFAARRDVRNARCRGGVCEVEKKKEEE